MTNEELYRHCREAVATVQRLQTAAGVHASLGEPLRLLPIGDFFITHSDRSVTYCDRVELYHFRDCAIRIGYLGEMIAKVRGMPLAHWKPPA